MKKIRARRKASKVTGTNGGLSVDDSDRLGLEAVPEKINPHIEAQIIIDLWTGTQIKDADVLLDFSTMSQEGPTVWQDRWNQLGATNVRKIVERLIELNSAIACEVCLSTIKKVRLLSRKSASEAQALEYIQEMMLEALSEQRERKRGQMKARIDEAIAGLKASLGGLEVNVTSDPLPRDPQESGNSGISHKKHGRKPIWVGYPDLVREIFEYVNQTGPDGQKLHSQKETARYFCSRCKKETGRKLTRDLVKYINNNAEKWLAK